MTVANIEAGAYNTGVGSIIDVAHALGVRLSDLLVKLAVEPSELAVEPSEVVKADNEVVEGGGL
jgi:hypothetical protein